MTATRLQLGTSRLEKLSPAARKVFIDKSWIHLGDSPQPILERVGRILLRGDPLFTRKLYQGTDFRQFFFQPKDQLPFEKDSFTFIYSEHFFEHLTPSLALELVTECHRVLKVGGVMRIVVPDAIYRTHEPPEVEGHPVHRPVGHPQKHLVRFTVDLLTDLVTQCGFQAIPLDYCTPERARIQRNPDSIRDEYGECADWPMVADMSYTMRVPSLVIDAVKTH